MNRSHRLGALLASTLLLVAACNGQSAGEDPPESSRDFVDENTQIFSVAYALGLVPLVDTTEDHVLMRIQVPAKEPSVFPVYSLFVIAAPVTQSEEIIVQVYAGTTKTQTVRGSTSRVIDLIEEVISPQAFLDSLDWTHHDAPPP